MNKKTQTKYELIARIITTSECSLADLTELCAIDFQTAFDMWEYKIGQEHNVVASGFALFNGVSESKTRAAFIESSPMQRLVYSSPEAGIPTVIEYLAGLVLANKLDAADECLAKLRSNAHIDFNEVLRTVVDTTFAMYCQRNNTRVPTFNKKQKTLLVNYIDKIKGPNKALLQQRMKEI